MYDSIQQLLTAALANDRAAARRVVQQAMTLCDGSEAVLLDLLWPAAEQLSTLARGRQIAPAALAVAARVLRTVAGQTWKSPARTGGRRLLVIGSVCVAGDLMAELLAAVAETRGWQVTFVGGGVVPKEIARWALHARPDAVAIVGSSAKELPAVRETLDTLDELGVRPAARVLACGGVFNRAEGLAEEMGMDAANDGNAALLALETADVGRRVRAAYMNN